MSLKCVQLSHSWRKAANVSMFMGYKNAKLDFSLSPLFNIIALVNVEIDLKMLKYAFRLLSGVLRISLQEVMISICRWDCERVIRSVAGLFWFLDLQRKTATHVLPCFK